MSDGPWRALLELTIKSEEFCQAAISVADPLAADALRQPRHLLTVLAASLNDIVRRGDTPAPTREFALQVTTVHESLREMLRRSAEEWPIMAPDVRVRLVSALSALEIVESRSQFEIDSEQNSRSQARTGLSVQTLQPYRSDIKTYRRLMSLYLAASAVLSGVLMYISYRVLFLDPVSSSQIPVAVCFILGVLALVLAAGHQAHLCRKSAAESARIYRQLHSVDEYLDPLPEQLQYLLRGTLVQRLFPRLIDDDNPLREEEAFPGTDSLMAAAAPELQELLELKRSQRKDREGTD